MFSVYVLHCNDNTLYTGYAADLEKRLEAHRQKKGAKYMRSRMPFVLVYSEQFADKSAAMRREHQIKQWPRRQKIAELNLILSDALK